MEKSSRSIVPVDRVMYVSEMSLGSVSGTGGFHCIMATDIKSPVRVSPPANMALQTPSSGIVAAARCSRYMPVEKPLERQ